MNVAKQLASALAAAFILALFFTSPWGASGRIYDQPQDLNSNAPVDACPSIENTPYFSIAYGEVTLDGAQAQPGTLVTATSPRGDLVGCFQGMTERSVFLEPVIGHGTGIWYQ